ncbi:type II toxin-antitoxin system RelE/ParE family toxin [Bradyrhizobium glycinis]|uniref:type II toxin-antitoxin system RelE/ParE family toxin n=1 Tax=Bradyrhizobium glycinis TaxID=2751812 RepID=UPI001FE83E5B|nr:type II toxin-antitoxin system RelE/ParE family toxin [Bradyrhizobium glycinis]
MILLSPDAVEDVERLRLFLDQHSPTAAQRALAPIWRAIERLEEFPNLGMQTENPELRQIVVRFGWRVRLHRAVCRPGGSARHPDHAHMARPRSPEDERVIVATDD